MSANSHVVVNHLWLLCISRAKPRKQLREFPGSFHDPPRWLARWVEAASRWLRMQLRDKRGEPKREAERADEQVPLFNFNRFTIPLNRTFFSLFSSPPFPSFHSPHFPFFIFFFFLVIQDLINLFGPEDLFRINSLWPPALF